MLVPEGTDKIPVYDKSVRSMVFESGGEGSRTCFLAEILKIKKYDYSIPRQYGCTSVPGTPKCPKRNKVKGRAVPLEVLVFYAQNQMFGVEHQHEHIVVSKRSRSMIETLAYPARFPYMQATQARYVWANARACQCVRKVASSSR